MTLSLSELDRLSADLDRGLSLPASWYYDPAIAALERERIFRRTWQYVGRTEQVADVGDYFTGVVGDIPVVVVSTEDGLKALVNVCRHRRHAVMSGEGNCKVMQCPYHAWTYNLNGSLRNAPRSDREADFSKDDYPLLSMPVATWGRWIFVNPDPGAPPLTKILGELPQLLAGSGLDLDQLKFWKREEWNARPNWKVLVENFLECYHCPVQHPAFSAVIDVRPDAYSLTPYEWFSSQCGSVRETISGKAPAYDTDGDVREAQFHHLWPNFTISINPGQPNLALDVWMPDGQGRTRGFSEHYFGPNVTQEWAEEMMAFNAQVSAEDDLLTSSVQHGLEVGIPDQGRFLVNSEHLIVHFQKLVLAALS